jgi:hypothetical protein
MGSLLIKPFDPCSQSLLFLPKIVLDNLESRSFFAVVKGSTNDTQETYSDKNLRMAVATNKFVWHNVSSDYVK